MIDNVKLRILQIIRTVSDKSTTHADNTRGVNPDNNKIRLNIEESINRIEQEFERSRF